MRALRHLALRPDAQRLFFDALQPALQGAGGATVDQPGQSFLEYSIQWHEGEGQESGR